MSQIPTSASEAEHDARRVARQNTEWVQRLARIGYAAKGVVYVIVGGLSAQAAFTPSDSPEGSEGALAALLGQPFGRAMLAVVALGLVGYVVWRLVQAALHPDHPGGGAKVAARRIGYLISAAAYSSLALEAVRLLRGTAGGQDNGAQHWTAMVLDEPFGRILVGLAGAGVAAFGLYEIYRGATSDVGENLRLEGVAARNRRRVLGLGRAGLAARGVVFGIIGWLVITAAVQYDASRAEGLQGALATLREQTYGPWLLVIVALGLMAYGLFQLVNARYRVIRPG